MLTLLPIVCFLCLLALARALQPVALHDGESPRAVRRESLLLACVAWSGVVVAISELLGLRHALTAPWVASAWGAVAALSASGAFVLCRRTGAAAEPDGARSPLAKADVLLLLGVALILLVLVVIISASPSNNWDTVSYHLPRVVHWIQNQSLSHYPAHDTRQLIHPPFAELGDLQFMILGGGDSFTSPLRLFFMVATLAGVSLIVRQLGGSVRGQVAAVVAAATISTHLLQAPVDKNDGIAAFFLVCTVHYLLCLRTRLSSVAAGAAGLALGLALLTKLTSYLFALPFLVWLSYELIKRHLIKSHRAAAWRPLALLVLFPLILNAGAYSRNIDVFGHPLSDPHFSNRLGAQRITGLTILSNAMRSATLQLSTPSESLNGYMKDAVVYAHGAVGLDANDPATTTPAGKYEVAKASTKTSTTASPWSFILLVVSCVMVFSRRQLRGQRGLTGYTLALLGAAALMFAFLKWQPTLARLHLGLLVLGSPVTGLVLTTVLSRVWSTLLFTGLLFSTAPWLMYSGDRHLLGQESIFRLSREQLEFHAEPGLRGPAHAAAEWIRARGYTSIGFDPARPAFAEYPLWKVLSSAVPGARFEDVGVENDSGKLVSRAPFRGFEPEVVVRIAMSPASRAAIRGGAGPPEEFMEYGGVRYSKRAELSRLVLYVPLR